MSCACEQKKLAGEYERVRRLAKAGARLLEKTVAVYVNADGTYDFDADPERDKKIVEYISPY